MIELDWKLTLGVVTILGGVLIAAAKSIFVTKSKIYDERGITIFMPRKELKEVCKEKHTVADNTFGSAIDSLNKLASTIVPRSEWENSYKERERRRNEDHKRVCQKLDELSMGQREIEKGLAKLYGLLENSHRATE